jgi:hypothetical protein
MIIRIEDAPGIKHISIDINFEGDDEPVIVQTSSKNSKPKQTPSYDNKSETPKDEEPLDLNTSFEVNTEIVERPVIPEVERDVKVSSEMVNAEY